MTAVACGGGSPTSPSPAPAIPFPLPADAPPDAAAAPGTTRLTITAIQLTRVSDPASPVDPNALQPGALYRLRAWIYCPQGLEDRVYSYHRTEFVGGQPQVGVYMIHVPIAAGYNYVDDQHRARSASVVSVYRFEIIFAPATVASKEITLTSAP